eukprot:2140554-Pleurochrysis_carterae.AAC.2
MCAMPEYDQAATAGRRRRSKKKADRVAVMIARMPCMMVKPSDDCAPAMALRTLGSMLKSMSSQSSVPAA